MTPLRPALPASTRRSIVAATSADVKSVPSLPLDALAQLERPHAAVLVRLPRLGETGRDARRRSPSVARNSKHWAMMPYEPRSCMPIGSSGPAGFWEATRMMPPGVPPGAASVRVPGVVSAPAVGVRVVARGVVVTAAGGDDRAEERHRQADDRAPPHEVTAVDAALGVRLDEVELLWADRARVPGRNASNPCSPLCSAGGGTCWLAPPAGRTLTAACGTVNRRSRYGCTVNGAMTGMAAYEGGRVPRVVVGGAGAESVADFVAESGASAAVLIVDESAVANGYVDGIAAALAASLGGSSGTSSDTSCRPASRTRRRSTPPPSCVRVDARSARDRRRRRQRARHRQAGGGRRRRPRWASSTTRSAPTRCPATAR